MDCRKLSDAKHYVCALSHRSPVRCHVVSDGRRVGDKSAFRGRDTESSDDGLFVLVNGGFKTEVQHASY